MDIFGRLLIIRLIFVPISERAKAKVVYLLLLLLLIEVFFKSFPLFKLK